MITYEIYPFILFPSFNSLKPGIAYMCQHIEADTIWPPFADDTFKRNFLNANVRISIKISLKSVPMGPINNTPALVQIMA